ncbi:MAG: BON domain-containing protein [Peptococcaceae bacterium]|nr:BON domain-containing protein [Peptococcaceae bacterium]
MARERDELLRKKVQEALDSNIETRAYGLKADVVKGEVRISGIVDTLAEKESLNKIISGIDGVRGIENNVAISTDGAIDDEDVAFEVMEELNATPNVDLRHVGARSVKGTVFLKGRVNSQDEIEAAVSAAAKARGVRGVVSQLEMETAREITLEDIFHSQVNNEKEEKRKGLY